MHQIIQLQKQQTLIQVINVIDNIQTYRTSNNQLTEIFHLRFNLCVISTKTTIVIYDQREPRMKKEIQRSQETTKVNGFRQGDISSKQNNTMLNCLRECVSALYIYHVINCLRITYINFFLSRTQSNSQVDESILYEIPQSNRE